MGGPTFGRTLVCDIAPPTVPQGAYISTGFAFGDLVELHERAKKSGHLVERDHVGTVRGGCVRRLVGFDEDRRHADGDRRPRHHWREFALTAGRATAPARLLHRMRGVHDDRIARLGQDRQAAHVGHQRVVAKGGAAFGQEDAAVSRTGDLGGDILHVPGRQELALLDIDHRAGFACGQE